MRVKFLAQGNNGSFLMGLELTTDRHPLIEFRLNSVVKLVRYGQFIDVFNVSRQ